MEDVEFLIASLISLTFLLTFSSAIVRFTSPFAFITTLASTSASISSPPSSGSTKSSAASAANAAIETVKATLSPTEDGDCFSAAVISDGSYDIPKGIIYGFPLKTTTDGKIQIIQGLEINSYAKEKLEITTKELLEEKEAISEII